MADSRKWAESITMYGSRLLTLIFWLIPGILTFSLGQYVSVSFQAVTFGVLSLVFGIWAFLIHGGPQVTGAGIFCGASGAFVGYASLWWNDYLDSEPPLTLVKVTAACYIVTVLMYTLFWWDTRLPVRVEKRDPKSARWAVVTGLLLTAAALIMHTVISDYSLRLYASDIAFVGIAIASLGLVGSHTTTRILSFQSVLLVALIFWFILVAFGGMGRLRIIALVATVGIIFSIQQRTRLLKILALVAVPIASEALTAYRSYLNFGYQPVKAEPTPDSDVSGIWTFARLIERDDLVPVWGDTFWSTLVIAVPREWWADKPVGFGAELTALLEPQLTATGHSMVATAFGEWYWNFGWWGLLFMIPLVGLAIKWLDRKRASLGKALESPRLILIAVLVVIASATLTDFVWNGTHTYVARMLYRSIVVLSLMLLVTAPRRAWVAKREYKTVPPVAKADR